MRVFNKPHIICREAGRLPFATSGKLAGCFPNTGHDARILMHAKSLQKERQCPARGETNGFANSSAVSSVPGPANSVHAAAQPSFGCIAAPGIASRDAGGRPGIVHRGCVLIKFLAAGRWRPAKFVAAAAAGAARKFIRE